jgi:guanine deaminase
VPPTDEDHLTTACRLAAESASGPGGPFAALVVRDGEVVATGTNRVTADLDPTAHAEVVALRAAGAALGTFDLGGCTLYCSCQPCPMCQAAAWWSRVDRVVFAASSADAAAAGFDDALLWAAVRGEDLPPAPIEGLRVPSATAPFEAWAANPDRVEY